MKATNFKWTGSIYLVASGVEHDLHNCYDFQCVIYDPGNGLLELRWRRGPKDRVADDLPGSINLHMKGVTEMRWLPRDSDLPFSEDNCLASFGYARGGDWTDGQFWVESEPEADWRWSFLFQSGAELQVAGDSATVAISP